MELDSLSRVDKIYAVFLPIHAYFIRYSDFFTYIESYNIIIDNDKELFLDWVEVQMHNFNSGEPRYVENDIKFISTILVRIYDELSFENILGGISYNIEYILKLVIKLHKDMGEPIQDITRLIHNNMINYKNKYSERFEDTNVGVIMGDIYPWISKAYK